jgi:putative heme-binding domain-containing protein
MRTAPLAAGIAALAWLSNTSGEDAPSPDAAAGQQPGWTVAEDAALLEKGRITSRKKALLRLGASPDPAADAVLLAQFRRYESSELPPAIWLELFEAAAKRDNPELKALLAKREATLAKSADPLTRFQECLEGGDGEKGREIFTKKPEAGCIRCHSIDGKGGAIGPELTWLRNSVQRTHILESIILPSSQIATGFQSAALKLKSGEELSGVVSAESDTEITITSVVDGTKRTVNANDVTCRTSLPSPMPPHFGAVLDKRAIRDLVEFLAAGD